MVCLEIFVSEPSFSNKIPTVFSGCSKEFQKLSIRPFYDNFDKVGSIIWPVKWKDLVLTGSAVE